MIEIVSLLGTSYSGKSTLAAELSERLAESEIQSEIIKKDQAIRAVGSEFYGKHSNDSGYSISGFLRYGPLPQAELHEWMNERIRTSLGLGKIAILEGGTRTRQAQAETLRNIELDEDGLKIYKLELPIQETFRRARRRRNIENRHDDSILIASAKLIGQYRGVNSADAPKVGDIDVTVLDAKQPAAVMASVIIDEILASRQ